MYDRPVEPYVHRLTCASPGCPNFICWRSFLKSINFSLLNLNEWVCNKADGVEHWLCPHH